MPKKRYRSKPNRETAVAPRHAGPAREADDATPTDKATQQLAQEREKVRHLEAEVQALRAAATATHAALLELQPAAGSAGAPPVPSLGPVHAPTPWWRTLRQTLAAVLFLRGRQALDLPTLVTAFEADGITGVQQTLDQHGSAAAARARHLLALAKHYQKLNQPGRSAILGRAAYNINPQPTVAKWLAFRLFDAGHIHEPLTLLQGPASTCVFSASEGKRVEEIKTLAKLAQELPAVPAKAEPAYEPTDGALLYVAASCLPYHNSGYTNRTHELNLALKAAGGKVTVVTRPGYPWDRPDRTGLPDRLSTHNEGLDYLHIRTPTLAAPLDEYFAQAADGLARVAKQDRVAAIHAASNYVNALPALIAARQLGLPFAYEMRGLWDMTRAAKIEDYEHSDRYRLGMQLEALLTKEADRVFVISEALGEYIRKEWDIDPAKIALLPNCVNLETVERAKKMAGPKPEVFTVGYAGSLVEYEGLDLLIDALAELKRSGTIVHARIIGDGPEREKLQERSKNSGLNGQVQFLGRLTPDEARARLAETHVAVLPRRADAVCRMVTPLKLVEARSLGLPVVVPDLDILSAEAGGRENSTLFAAGDARSLASGLALIAANGTDLATHALSAKQIWHHHASALLAHARVVTKEAASNKLASSGEEPYSKCQIKDRRNEKQIPAQLATMPGLCKRTPLMSPQPPAEHFTARNTRASQLEGSQPESGAGDSHYKESKNTRILDDRPAWTIVPAKGVGALVVRGTLTLQGCAQPHSSHGKEALVLVHFYDNGGRRLENVPVPLPWSTKYKSSFRYLGNPDGKQRLLLELSVPPGVAEVHLGFRRFEANQKASVKLKDLEVFVAGALHGTLGATTPPSDGKLKLLAKDAIKKHRKCLFSEAVSAYARLGNSVGFHRVEKRLTECLSRIPGGKPLVIPEVPYKQLLRLTGFQNTELLLYGDIDLNSVDGSSIWLSSMAGILGGISKTIVVSKNNIRRDVVLSNVCNRHNVLILTPSNFQPDLQSLDLVAAKAFLEALDHTLCGVRWLVVRGLEAAKALCTDRLFHKRLQVYLTDINTPTSLSAIEAAIIKAEVSAIARQAAFFFTQTPQIAECLRSYIPHPIEMVDLPPPVPDTAIRTKRHKRQLGSIITLGYSGKIAPQWGILELVDWVLAMRVAGVSIEVTIIGDKVSGAGDESANKIFRSSINAALSKISATRLGALSRAESLAVMSGMDFSWCWRPAAFENQTLELSTKLVEGVIAGQACIAYPNDINVRSLGPEYPFFARNLEELQQILARNQTAVPAQTRRNLLKKHATSAISKSLSRIFKTKNKAKKTFSSICIATHDAKFIHPFYSWLKHSGIPVHLDKWEWGHCPDEALSRTYADNSDVVMCEWGLANAVWYSRNLPPGKRLIVRVHRQEVGPRAAKLSSAIDHSRVDDWIFVSAWVRDEAIRMFNLPPTKTRVIPNFVLDDEFLFSERALSNEIRLGIVGIIPQMKRLDRAIDLVAHLVDCGANVTLSVKGHRPETLEWMHAPSRASELDYYQQLYNRLESDPRLRGRVSFSPWDNNVKEFYSGVDHIVSPSDFESFHYALADGVLSGCHPIVWERPHAAETFSPEWIVKSVDEAANSILAFRSMSKEDRAQALQQHRQLITSRYSYRVVWRSLATALGINVSKAKIGPKSNKPN